MKYYISRSGESEGPFTYDEIAQLLGTQEITGETMCVPEGSQAWRRVCELVESEKRRRAAQIERDRKNGQEPARAIPAPTVEISFLDRVMWGCVLVGLVLSVLGGIAGVAGGNWVIASIGGSFLFWAVLVGIFDRLNKILEVLSRK